MPLVKHQSSRPGKRDQPMSRTTTPQMATYATDVGTRATGSSCALPTTTPSSITDPVSSELLVFLAPSYRRWTSLLFWPRLRGMSRNALLVLWSMLKETSSSLNQTRHLGNSSRPRPRLLLPSRHPWLKTKWCKSWAWCAQLTRRCS